MTRNAGIWLRAIAMTATALAALVTAGAGTAAAGTLPCPSAFGSFSTGNWPAACWRPFGPQSPFNKELPANPRLSPDSAAIIADLMHYGYSFRGDGGHYAMTSNGRDAVYYPQPSDPLVTIDCTYHWGPGTCQGSNRVDVNRWRIHVPAGAQPDAGPDQHMTIVDQTKGVEFDFDHASLSGHTLTVWAGGEIPIGADLGTGLGVPGTAADFSTLAGLIRAPELAGGTIDHALAISIPCTAGYVWPADRANGFSCRQAGQSAPPGDIAPALGTLFQLDMSDAQIGASGAPAWERAIMTAMAHYGLYVNDTNGWGQTFYTETESDVSYTSVGGAPLMGSLFRRLGATYYAPQSVWILSGRGIPLSRLRVVDPCVPRGTCAPSTSVRDRPSAAARIRTPAGCKRTTRTKGHRKRRKHRRPARCVLGKTRH